MLFKKKDLLLAAVMVLIVVMMTACGGSDKTDYENLREVSWEGTELTIKLGENKSTGFEWDTKPQDDKVIDYSVNRKFKLSGDNTLKGKAIGTLSAGFEGKGAGTTEIVCTTPVGWDGSGEGATYIVTVTVNDDGTIASAEGKEGAAAPSSDDDDDDDDDDADDDDADKTGATLEDYFNEHPDELEEIRNSLNDNEEYKKVLTMKVDVKKNTIKYIYTFNETYSDEQVAEFKPELKKGLEEAEEDMDEKIEQMEKGYGIDDIKVYMEYQNGDGKKICSDTID